MSKQHGHNRVLVTSTPQARSVDEELERVLQQVAQAILYSGGDYDRESLVRAIAKKLDVVVQPHLRGVTVQLKAEIRAINIQCTLSNEDDKQ